MYTVVQTVQLYIDTDSGSYKFQSRMGTGIQGQYMSWWKDSTANRDNNFVHPDIDWVRLLQLALQLAY